MKKCIKCKLEKDLSEFYKHSQMKDKHLNKCISCCKLESIKNNSEKSKNPDWILSERKRGREKYKRLRPKTDNKSLIHKLFTRLWKAKFPEKRLAQQAAQHIDCPKDYHRHHWSYLKEHQKDVIILSPSDHRFHHRYIIYDEERNMFRTLDGLLLDTKEKYSNYINLMKEED